MKNKIYIFSFVSGFLLCFLLSFIQIGPMPSLNDNTLGNYADEELCEYYKEFGIEIITKSKI